MFMVQFKKEHLFFAVWTFQRVVAHSKQKAVAPGVEIKDNPMF